MDNKQYLIGAVNSSDLPEEVKKNLLQKIALQGATSEVANEIADLIDLEADVLELNADTAEKTASALDDLAGKPQN